MKHFAKNLVVVICLLALGAFGAWIALRPRLPRGDGFTDGEQFLSATRTREELRLARWETPQPLAGLAARIGGGGASEPFLDVEGGGGGADRAAGSGRGRIFFAKGEPGSEDLWLATPEGDDWVVRPLAELNSPRRETAPAFHDGWLYFASDRAGGLGGLDLWRAPLAGDHFLAPENLGAPVNSEADESDPAPRTTFGADGGAADGAPALELWFACNREAAGIGNGDFDLMSARSDGVRFAPPQLVDAVHSPYDERAPAFSPDGRVLLFASNRPGGAGGFDLWRALWKEGVLQPPANLGTPNSAADEIGATPGDDGFTLLFGSDRAERGRFELLRTRTRELFPVDAPRFTLADFTVLLLLSLVALLAWLARRWEALDVLWKCMVVSLLVHLGFLWYSRRVDVEAKAATFGTPRDTFEIHVLGDILADVARLEDRARGEEVGAGGEDSAEALLAGSLSRASVLPGPDDDESGPGESSTTIERSAGGEVAAAPAATERTLTRGSVASSLLAGDSVDPVHDATDSFERMGGSAPDVALAAKSGDGSPEGTSRIVAAAGASFVPMSAGGEPGSGSADAGGSAREAAGTPVPRARSAGGGEPGGGEPAAVARDRRPATRARGAHEGPVVATERPTDRIAVAAPEGDAAGDGSGDGGHGTHGGLVLAPSVLAASGQGAGAGSGAGSGVGSGSGGTVGPQRAKLGGLGAGQGSGAGAAAIGDSQPRAEAPLAGGSSTHGDGSGNADGHGAGDGEGAGLLTRGAAGPDAPSGAIGPGGAEARPAVALAMPKEGRGAGSGGAGEGAGEGVGGSDGHGSEPAGLVLAPAANPGTGHGAGLGAGVGTNAGSIPGATLGGGAGGVAGPTRVSFTSLAAGGAGGGGGPELGPKNGSEPFLDLPIGSGGSGASGDRGDVDAPGGVARLYERRFGSAKEVAVREGGGSAETERAVLAGLRYLAKVQRPKGFFGDQNDVDPGSKYRDFRVGKTGLAVLAFLGAGHTHRSNTEFSENVTRALAWIVARQDDGSGHFGNSEAYSHGIATYALAECYAITKDEAIRPPLERAIAHLLAMQTNGTGDPRKDGGWTYYYTEGPGVDEFPRASISAWQVMALESAKVGGLEVPDAALAAARTYFLKSFDPGFGGFRYTHNPSWINGGYGTLPASTPASMFALTLLGQKDHARVAAAEEYVVDRLPDGYRFRGEDAFVRRGQANVYFWYYSTLALFCRGGSAWREWNDALKSTLLPAQQRDGSWEAIDVYAQRYANDDRQDRSYTTTMCVLMLEVYYRYFTPLLGKLEKP